MSEPVDAAYGPVRWGLPLFLGFCLGALVAPAVVQAAQWLVLRFAT